MENVIVVMMLLLISTYMLHQFVLVDTAISSQVV